MVFMGTEQNGDGLNEMEVDKGGSGPAPEPSSSLPEDARTTQLTQTDTQEDAQMDDGAGDGEGPDSGLGAGDPGEADSEDDSADPNREKRPWVKWTKEEHDKLVELVERFGTERTWSLIAQHIPGRSGKQCRERWLNHIYFDARRGHWSHQEEYILATQHAKHGSHWCKIAKHLEGRPDNAVKNHWNAIWRSKVQSKPRSILWLYISGLKAERTPQAALQAAVDSWEAAVEPQLVRDVLGRDPKPKPEPPPPPAPPPAVSAIMRMVSAPGSSGQAPAQPRVPGAAPFWNPLAILAAKMGAVTAAPGQKGAPAPPPASVRLSASAGASPSNSLKPAISNGTAGVSGGGSARQERASTREEREGPHGSPGFTRNTRPRTTPSSTSLASDAAPSSGVASKGQRPTASLGALAAALVPPPSGPVAAGPAVASGPASALTAATAAPTADAGTAGLGAPEAAVAPAPAQPGGEDLNAAPDAGKLPFCPRRATMELASTLNGYVFPRGGASGGADKEGAGLPSMSNGHSLLGQIPSSTSSCGWPSAAMQLGSNMSPLGSSLSQPASRISQLNSHAAPPSSLFAAQQAQQHQDKAATTAAAAAAAAGAGAAAPASPEQAGSGVADAAAAILALGAEPAQTTAVTTVTAMVSWPGGDSAMGAGMLAAAGGVATATGTLASGEPVNSSCSMDSTGQGTQVRASLALEFQQVQQQVGAAVGLQEAPGSSMSSQGIPPPPGSASHSQMDEDGRARAIQLHQQRVLLAASQGGTHVLTEVVALLRAQGLDPSKVLGIPNLKPPDMVDPSRQQQLMFNAFDAPQPEAPGQERPQEGQQQQPSGGSTGAQPAGQAQQQQHRRSQADLNQEWQEMAGAEAPQSAQAAMQQQQQQQQRRQEEQQLAPQMQQLQLQASLQPPQQQAGMQGVQQGTVVQDMSQLQQQLQLPANMGQLQVQGMQLQVQQAQGIQPLQMQLQGMQQQRGAPVVASMESLLAALEAAGPNNSAQAAGPIMLDISSFRQGPAQVSITPVQLGQAQQQQQGTGLQPNSAFQVGPQQMQGQGMQLPLQPAGMQQGQVLQAMPIQAGQAGQQVRSLNDLQMLQGMQVQAVEFGPNGSLQLGPAIQGLPQLNAGAQMGAPGMQVAQGSLQMGMGPPMQAQLQPMPAGMQGMGLMAGPDTGAPAGAFGAMQLGQGIALGPAGQGQMVQVGLQGMQAGGMQAMQAAGGMVVELNGQTFIMTPQQPQSNNPIMLQMPHAAGMSMQMQ